VFPAPGQDGGHGGAVSDLELGEDPFEVGLDGVDAQVQRRGDLRVGLTPRYQLGDLALARAEYRSGS